MHQKRNERVVDLDPQETAEWVEALDQVIDEAGPDRAAYLLEQLTERARVNGAELPIHLNTPYVNTIGPEEEVPYPGDRAMERRIKSLIRWNAMAMVVRQNKYDAASAAIFPPMLRWPRCSKWVSTISSTPATAISRAT